MHRKFIQVMSVLFVAFALFVGPRFVEKFCYHGNAVSQRLLCAIVFFFNLSVLKHSVKHQPSKLLIYNN